MANQNKIPRSAIMLGTVGAAVALLLGLLLLVTWQEQQQALAALRQDINTLVAGLASPTPTASPTPQPSPTPHPAQARLEALRAENGVRPLDPLENELSVLSLPDGVYGFAVPWIINTDPTGVVGGTGVARISLNRESFGTLQMEVHRTQDGEIKIVGYVSPEQLEELQAANAIEQVEMTLFMAPYDTFEHPIAVSLSNIVFAHERRVEDIYVIDMIVMGWPQTEEE